MAKGNERKVNENTGYPKDAETWCETEYLQLLEGWTRDGHTMKDIAYMIGITYTTILVWREKYPEIAQAIKCGREMVDYRVEGALLKAALGYKTKEVKITTILRYGKLVETQKEVLTKEVAPNVSAIQVYLYNRLPQKWRNMNNAANAILPDDPDTSVQITVTRAKPNEDNSTVIEEVNNADDMEYIGADEVNTSVKVRGMTPEEKAQAKKAKKLKEKEKDTEVEMESGIDTEEVGSENRSHLMNEDYWDPEFEG